MCLINFMVLCDEFIVITLIVVAFSLGGVVGFLLLAVGLDVVI